MNIWRIRGIRGAVMGAVLLAVSGAGHAANWLMLQGTEPPDAAGRAKVWGFIQPEFQSTGGSKLPAGPWKGQKAVFNQIGPDLDSDSTFNVRRARLGVRGTAFPLDNRVNYFFLAEAGNNGITKFGSAVALTDASITLNHIKYARLRLGQFKYPGSEEGLQAIHVFDYINFTNVSNFLLLERFFDSDGSVPGMDPNKPNGPVGAFRDIGIQLFDSIRAGDWEHSYAFMVGNGNGINRGNNNGKYNYYAYLSTERIFGGKGPRRQGWKLYGWFQTGERTLRAGPDQTKQDFDRTRWGFGTTLRKDKWRGAAEVIFADGMIFNGTDGGAVPGSLNNKGTAVSSFNVLPDDKAWGFYVDLGYRIHPKIELDIRYDYLDRGTETDANERVFQTVTFGAQYFFNKKVRLLVNYELRDAEAPELPGSAPPNQILDAMDDRISAQVLAVF